MLSQLVHIYIGLTASLLDPHDIHHEGKNIFKLHRDLSIVPGHSFGQVDGHFEAGCIWEILVPGRPFGHAGGHFGTHSAILVPGDACLDMQVV